MKLGLFVPTLKKDYDSVSASIWIRVYQMIAHYEAYGIKVYINNPFIKYDVAIFYRLSNKYSLNFIKYLKRISKKVYWDTCVNYYDLHSHTTQEQVEITKEISSLVDGVITSTEEIAKKAILYNENVFTMEDPINIEHFKYKSSINFTHPTFGWSGISTKAISLNKYKEKIDKLMIISEKKPKLDLKYQFYRWHYKSFPFLLSQVDIALLPREYHGDPYNLGHSSFKALVFAIQGIPIIANKLPSYEKLAQFYDGIVFLEDYDCFESSLEALKERELDVEHLYRYYSCENQAFRVLHFLELLE